MRAIETGFYDQDPRLVARRLLGRIIRRRYAGVWLAARIIETEAYLREEKGSHASLGESPSRRALFMPAGTVYMYYARGGDSLNISCAGAGNAVLIKSGLAWQDEVSGPQSLQHMHALNPRVDGGQRPLHRLCAGQTLLCRALALKVPDWDQRQFDRDEFFIEAGDDAEVAAVQTRRLGIPAGRDEHLPYRFVEARYAAACTHNPLTARKLVEGVDYWRLPPRAAPDHPTPDPGWPDPQERGYNSDP